MCGLIFKKLSDSHFHGYDFFWGVVSRAILIARAPSPGDVSVHPLVKVW